MADIEAVELIVIAQGKEDEKGNSWKLRLAQWVVDGEAKSIKLEKRRFWRNEQGELRTGKADGLRLQDLEACKPHWAKIMELMKNPPSVELKKAVEVAKSVMPGATEVNDDEIPF